MVAVGGTDPTGIVVDIDSVVDTDIDTSFGTDWVGIEWDDMRLTSIQLDPAHYCS